MRQILSKSGQFHHYLQWNKLGVNKIMYIFSAMPPNLEIQKAVEFQFKFRSILKLSELNEYIQENKQDIKKYGKTILLQFLNEYPMQSFRRSRDESNTEFRSQKYALRKKIYLFLSELQNLNFYELNMRYAIFKKLLSYSGQNQMAIKEAQKAEEELIHMLKTQDLHVSDLTNWLYMLPINYKMDHSCFAFDIIQKKFQLPEVREYFKSQRALPALIKRIYELDWFRLRKYKHLIRFLCYDATSRDIDSLQQLVNQLQRLVVLKLHLIGEKVIPKMVDEIIQKFDKQFQLLTKNKQLLLRVFSMFKYLPLNYNLQFFNKVHDHLKSIKQLPSHLLLFIPYNKLSESQISFLQSKMVSLYRQDIASRMIYTIYNSDYKSLLTPLMVKQVYANLLDMWKKSGPKISAEYQTYIAIIFRFSKLNNPIINQSKLKQIFSSIVDKIEAQSNFESFHVISFPGLIALLQLLSIYGIHLDQKVLINKYNHTFKLRKQKNTLPQYTQFILSAIRVHCNATSKISRYYLTKFISQIVNNPQVQKGQKIQTLFLIQKALNPEQQWANFSKQLCNQLTQDVDYFVESYLKYDQKTLKLTNFMFTVLYEKKVSFSTILDLLSGVNLKFLTSLKGKLISPLKKYINEMDLSNFDITNVNMNTLSYSFKLLFYFRHQIPQFMQFYAIKIIEKIQQKLKNGQYINGKQFALLSNYIMEAVANIDIKKKTNIIESIVTIIKTVRKNQGIFLKVYELDFLCNHQKYIKINQDVLEHHWNDIVETLKKTDRIQHHKELFFILIKIHCQQFAQLNEYDLRYFQQKCIQLIERSSLNLSQIKESLGYEILKSDNHYINQKLKIYISGLVKLAFRREKHKQNYFLYEYYLKFFSKIQEKEMINEICEKLLYEKLYPIEISNILPILNRNQIKNRKFIKRILEIMELSDPYVSFEKMQVISWLDKILYDLSENEFKVSKLKNKVHQDVVEKISILKAQMKSKLIEQDRSIQSGYQIQDPNFDKNYKVFIEYAWSSLKQKDVYSPEMKFICRYLYFSLDKIKGRIEHPEERKQISKIKLYHVLKYIKEMKFFEIDQSKVQNAVREKNILLQRTRKNKVLQKMQKDLNVMKIQTCQKLQKKLNELSDVLTFQAKYDFSLKNIQGSSSVVEYYVEEKPDKGSAKIKNKFVIHTVKNYHITPQSNFSTSQNLKPNKQKVGNTVIINDEVETEFNQIMEDIQGDEQIQSKHSAIQESYLSLQLKPEKELFSNKSKKQDKKQTKPLFSLQKVKKTSKQAKISSKIQQFESVLKVQKSSQDLYRNYNGYLRVQKSLIELLTGTRCIIYDPEKNMFFE